MYDHSTKTFKIFAHNHIGSRIKNREVSCIYRADLSHRGLLSASTEIYKTESSIPRRTAGREWRRANITY